MVTQIVIYVLNWSQPTSRQNKFIIIDVCHNYSCEAVTVSEKAFPTKEAVQKETKVMELSSEYRKEFPREGP